MLISDLCSVLELPHTIMRNEQLPNYPLFHALFMKLKSLYYGSDVKDYYIRKLQYIFEDLTAKAFVRNVCIQTFFSVEGHMYLFYYTTNLGCASPPELLLYNYRQSKRELRKNQAQTVNVTQPQPCVILPHVDQPYTNVI